MIAFHCIISQFFSDQTNNEGVSESYPSVASWWWLLISSWWGYLFFYFFSGIASIVLHPRQVKVPLTAPLSCISFCLWVRGKGLGEAFSHWVRNKLNFFMDSKHWLDIYDQGQPFWFQLAQALRHTEQSVHTHAHTNTHTRTYARSPRTLTHILTHTSMHTRKICPSHAVDTCIQVHIICFLCTKCINS